MVFKVSQMILFLQYKIKTMVNDKDKYVEKRRVLLQKLAEIAKAKNITHEIIAERTGFIRNNVSRMFAGKYPPSLDNFLMLCDAVEVRLSELEN